MNSKMQYRNVGMRKYKTSIALPPVRLAIIHMIQKTHVFTDKAKTSASEVFIQFLINLMAVNMIKSLQCNFVKLLENLFLFSLYLLKLEIS